MKAKAKKEREIESEGGREGQRRGMRRGKIGGAGERGRGGQTVKQPRPVRREEGVQTLGPNPPLP